MKQKKVSERQLASAEKNIEWMEVSKPSVAAREIGLEVSSATPDEAVADGKAMRPHERGCGRSHPIRGTNSEDLREWCGEHEV